MLFLFPSSRFYLRMSHFPEAVLISAFFLVTLSFCQILVFVYGAEKYIYVFYVFIGFCHEWCCQSNRKLSRTQAAAQYTSHHPRHVPCCTRKATAWPIQPDPIGVEPLPPSLLPLSG